LKINDCDKIFSFSPLNYFSPYNRYLFNLTAEESFPDRPSAISTAIVQINLQNANANDPIFILANQTFYISETASVDTQFGTVYATDADNDGIIYSITSNHLQFSINPLTGVLKLERTLHSSSQTNYSVTITAEDDASSCFSLCPHRTISTNIIIIVTTVNKQSPTFSGQKCGSNISFEENNAMGHVIESLMVFDDDRGDNGQINISFPSEQSRTTG
jgi:hypothetical protein